MTTAGGLRGCDVALSRAYDVGLVDLDGVVYLGGAPVNSAAESLRRARADGMRLAFVTNNASRTAEAVARHLCELGIQAASEEVVTSAHAAGTLLRDRLDPGSRVLVVGGEGLRRAVEDVGLTVVESSDDEPAAVAQGYTAQLRYGELAEAALALRAGALWVASNADSTIPTTRGLLPGNGALVAALRTATGREPLFAGKPDLPLHAEAVRRTGATHPLVIGDRLDTDIEGAVRARTDSLLVLTGVTSTRDLLDAPPQARPTYIARDLHGLLAPHPAPRRDGRTVSCGSWRVVHEGSVLRVESGHGTTYDDLDALRALCAASWTPDAHPVVRVEGSAELLESLDLDSR